MRYLLLLLFAVSCYGQPWLETPKKKPWPADNFARSGAMGYTSTGNYPWTGSMGIGANGVTNAPGLGTNLFLNPGFDSDVSWSKGTGWTIGGGTASHGSATASYIKQDITTIGGWYNLNYTITTNIIGSFYAAISGSFYTPAQTTAGTYIYIKRATSAINNGIYADTSSTGSVDNAYIYLINLTNTFSYITLPSANCIVTVPIKRGTTGFQSGSVICLDSSTYTNFIIGYYDGNTSILVDSCVNGIYTNLITKSITYSDGANLTLRFNADNGWLNAYYNNQPAGQSKLTSIWPSFKNYKTAGLFQTWTNSSITNFSTSPWVDYPVDNFTRADGALGNTSTGSKAWTGSTFSIGSNHATNAPTASTNTYVAYLPAYASPSVIVNASIFRGTTGYFHGVLSNYDPATGTNGLVAYLDGAGSCKCDAFVNGNKTNYITGAVTYADGANIELQSSSTAISLYYNGTQVSSTKTTGIWTGFTNFTTVGIYLNSTNGYLTNFYTAPYSL